MEINNPFEAILSELAEIRADIAKIKIPEPPSILHDSLTKEQAKQFLSENGLPMKDGQFYSLTSTGGIPSKRIGKRLVLSRKELLHWIESKKVQRVIPEKKASDLLADAANRKMRRKGGTQYAE